MTNGRASDDDKSVAVGRSALRVDRFPLNNVFSADRGFGITSLFHALLIALLGIYHLISGGAAHAAVVRLRPSVTIEHPMIVLGDIAEIIDNDAEIVRSLKRLPLQPAPDAGECIWLDLDDVKDRLRRRGVDLSRLSFAGVRKTELACTSGVRFEHPPASRTPATGTPSNPSRDWQAIIARMLKRSIAESTGLEVGRFEVEVHCDAAVQCLETTAAPNWELIVPKAWQPGYQTVTLEVPAEPTPQRRAIRVLLIVRTPVVVPSRTIARGATITASDVLVTEEAIRNRMPDWIADPKEVIGREATRTLDASRPIAARDVRSLPVVFRGNQITVLIRSGRAVIDLIAEARDDGGVGDWIDAINPATQEPLRSKVRVTGLNTAEMPETAPPTELVIRSPSPRLARNPRGVHSRR